MLDMNNRNTLITQRQQTACNIFFFDVISQILWLLNISSCTCFFSALGNLALQRRATGEMLDGTDTRKRKRSSLFMQSSLNNYCSAVFNINGIFNIPWFGWSLQDVSKDYSDLFMLF